MQKQFIHKDVFTHIDLNSGKKGVYDVIIINHENKEHYCTTVNGTYVDAINAGLLNIFKYNQNCIIDRIDRITNF